jgi:hypothetical protein
MAVEEKTQDFAFIGALNRFKHGQNKYFQNRRDICLNWLPNHNNYTSAVCGSGDLCPTLSQALLDSMHVEIACQHIDCLTQS